MKTVRLLTAVFLLWTVPALAQTEVNRIYDASEMMDNIEVAKSMEVFSRALSSYSQSYLTNYELGYAYYLQEDYTRAGRIFSRLSRDMSVDDRLYQVWGNSYADRGNDRKAEKIYRRGLKAFPHSGALHMELGALAFKDKRYDEALMYFERGIELDPSYPDNYWRAAGIYLSSPESVWGMIYGEIYMNMVCNGEQNMEVSRLLAEAYDSNIWHEKNDSGQDLIYISFSENNSIWYDETLKVMRFPYGVAVYEPTLGNAVVKVGLPPFSIDELCRIRDIFVDEYFSEPNDYGYVYPNLLFDRQRQIKQAGHMEAYSRWILRGSDPEAFNEWCADNKEQWRAFVEWFNSHELTVDEEHNFRSWQYTAKLPDK